MGYYFTGVDYVIFFASLVLSSLVGVWFAYKDRKNQTTETFLLGNKHMPLIPTMLSLVASLLSGVSLLSYPAEIYTYGTAFTYNAVALALSMIFFNLFMLPKLFEIKSVSMYHYFLERFDSKLLRMYASILWSTTILIYMAVVQYAPAVALTSVTTIPEWLLILAVGLVCIAYTSVGGLKAVVWTDTLQAIIIYGGVFALIVKGTVKLGGFGAVFKLNAEGGRFDALTDLNPSPFVHSSLLIILFGQFLTNGAFYSTNQMVMQRCRAMGTLKRARNLVWISIAATLLIKVMVYFVGIEMYAYYKDCDPLKSKQVQTKDQLVIHFMMDLFNNVPGLPGLYLACLFSGTLSTVSSGINSLSAVGLAEFVQPIRPQMDEKTAIRTTKLIGVLYGLLSMGMAFAAGPLGGILSTLVASFGALSGPLAGLLVLGLFFPFANKIGSSIGVLVGSAITMWIFVGGKLYGRPKDTQSLSIANCSQCLNANGTSTGTGSLFEATTMATVVDNPHVNTIFDISYFLYASIAIIITVVVGVIASLVVVGIRRFGNGSRVEPTEEILVDLTKEKVRQKSPIEDILEYNRSKKY